MKKLLMKKQVKKVKSIFFILALVVTASCSRGKYMTYDDYHKIAMGENISDVQVQVGRPYEIKEHSPHRQEYVYIERISLNEHREVFRKYILTVEHDKIIDKKLVEEVSSPVQFLGN
jgi:hypothetical protein